MTTSIDVDEARAQILHDALVKGPRPGRVEDLTIALPQFAQWRPAILDAAVARLVADGRITEDATGSLRVHDRRSWPPPPPPATLGIGLPEVRR